jgi:hypothetical protein
MMVKYSAVGDVTVDCDVLHDGETGLKIVTFTPVTSENATKMGLAPVAGIH